MGFGSDLGRTQELGSLRCPRSLDTILRFGEPIVQRPVVYRNGRESLPPCVDPYEECNAFFLSHG